MSFGFAGEGCSLALLTSRCGGVARGKPVRITLFRYGIAKFLDRLKALDFAVDLWHCASSGETIRHLGENGAVKVQHERHSWLHILLMRAGLPQRRACKCSGPTSHYRSRYWYGFTSTLLLGENLLQKILFLGNEVTRLGDVLDPKA